MSVLTEKLDRIASTLENQGLIHEAESIDMISNTLEAFEKQAWTADKSPIFLKFFAPALNAAKAGRIEIALKSLNMGDGMKKALVESRLDIPEFKFFSQLWDQAKAALSNGDATKASVDLEKAQDFFPKIEEIINSDAPGYIAPQKAPQTGSPPGSVVFPAKGVAPKVPKPPQVPGNFAFGPGQKK